MRRWRVAVLGFVLFVASCGPIQATTGITRAEEELRTAQLMEADRLSPYEYTKSDRLLQMAKRCQGGSEFEAARIFADEALRYAVMAKQNVPANIRQQIRMPVGDGGAQ